MEPDSLLDFNPFDDQETPVAAGPEITTSNADVTDSLLDFETLVTEAPNNETVEEEQEAPVEGEAEAEAEEGEAQLLSANVSMRGRSSSKANKKVSASLGLCM